MADNPINDLGNRYHAFIQAHPDAAAEFAEAIEDVLTDAGVTFDRVVARVKAWKSLKQKAKRTRADGTPQYPDPWRDIHDVIGVRVTVFHSTEIPRAVTALTESFTVRRSVDKTAQTRISGTFGYGSHHLVLEADERSHDVTELDSYHGMSFEVQIRTVLQHAWAEFEHDIRYKSNMGSPDPRVDRAFTLAAGLIELADQQFDQIAALQGAEVHAADDVELSAETLPGVLAVVGGTRYPRPRSDDYPWLNELLSANGITTVGQLRRLLTPADVDAVRRAMAYRYRPGQVRLIDDLLLARFGEGHIARTGDTGRRPKARPPRLRRRLAALRRASLAGTNEVS
ncbi:GTP pyrophosphokinase [Corynebacterium atypicum]|uniref:GTP pyrophosphokinase n=1 Tax=Corynebacterium atypicum TaxID=191610 RepID=A0ABM5QNG5_9CORY|nr:GTP pyrophosphokinase [Corynebacterium atypicum]AIG64402.1 GTP pyrophosphokinase [Corynebacterium atypicum]